MIDEPYFKAWIGDRELNLFCLSFSFCLGQIPELIRIDNNPCGTQCFDFTCFNCLFIILELSRQLLGHLQGISVYMPIPHASANVHLSD